VTRPGPPSSAYHAPPPSLTPHEKIQARVAWRMERQRMALAKAARKGDITIGGKPA
jgi:hypothetical protein